MSTQGFRSSIRRWLRLYGAVLVPLLGLGELGAHLHCMSWAPAIDSWSAVVEPVRAMGQPGDLIVVSPRWAEPLARQALDAELMPLRDVARADERRHPTALEISVLGQRDPALQGWREIERRQHGEFELRRLENRAFAPLRFDFVAALSPDRAQVGIGSANTPCRFREQAPVRAGGLGGHPTFPRERFQCPGGAYMNASVTVIADQDFRPRRCIWAHPPRRGALRLRFSDVDLGDVIAGHGGLYWIVERERMGAPIELSVQVDGQPVGRFVHHDGDGWAGFEFPLGERAGTKAEEVEFAISSTQNRHRHFCFEAISR